MTERERVMRPKLERTRPRRDWSSFAWPQGGPGAEGSTERAAEPVRRAVDLGYRVVDEYMRQGQAAARLLAGGPAGADAWVSEMQELGGRMLRLSSDMAAVWFELLGNAAPWAAGSPPTARGPEVIPPAAAASPVTALVTLEVETRRATAVTLDLHIGELHGPLVAHELRGEGAGLPRLRPSLMPAERPGDPLRLRIPIPDDQPAGTYNGLVVDADSSRPVGFVSVRVGQEPQ